MLHDWQALAAMLVLSTLFALFPDIDTNSKGQNIFFGLALAADVLLIWSGNIQAAAYLGLVAMLPISIIYYGAAVSGYFSHPLLDGLIVKWFRVKTSVFAD